jgi:poly(3-hydroxybutyrate) depolymerase
MSQVYSNPYSPAAYMPFAPRFAAGFELLHRLGKEYEKPPWGLETTTIDGEEVTVVERIELSKPFCRLIKFERLMPTRLKRRKADPTVLLFAPLSGHHATLLRDTVRALLPNHEVYVTDWLDARTVPLSHGPFHLHDYVAYAMEFIRHLGPQVHLISVCQPTVPVLAAVSLLSTLKDPKLPRTMTMMGGPIDTRRSPTEVNNLATDKPFKWFERTVIYRVPGKYAGAGRLVYPGFLQHAGFVAMNPDRHAESHWDFYMQLVRGDDEDAEGHRKFYDEYNAVLDMPAEYYLDTIRTVFQEHQLPAGRWVVPVNGRDMLVTPADISKVALLCIEGELDDISGIGQTSAALDLCSGLPTDRKHYMVAEGAGHYGIFSGRRWRETICPRIGAFIREHT